MYVALGFCLAGLLAVALIPSIWRRAVRLTRQAVEATTPMTHADVRAEIAALRARHALEYRRLEAGIERLQQQVTDNRIARDRAEALSGDLRKEYIAREQELADAMGREADLRREIRENEEALAVARSRLRDLERTLKRMAGAQAVAAGSEAATAGPGEAGEGAALAAIGAQQEGDALGKASELARVTALETEIAALRRRLKRAEQRKDGADTDDAAAKVSRQDLRARDDRLFEAESRLVAAQAEITRLSVLAEGAGEAAGSSAEADRLGRENERLRAELRADAEFRALRSELAELASAVVASLGTDEDLEPVTAEAAEGPADASGRKAEQDNVTLSLAARIRAARSRLTGKGQDGTAKDAKVKEDGGQEGPGSGTPPPILPGPARAASSAKRKAGG
jgi:chromosome segregation ATPase